MHHKIPDWLGKNLLLFGIFVCFLLGGLFLVGPDQPGAGAAGMQLAVAATRPAVTATLPAYPLDTPASATLPPYYTDPSVTDGVIIWGIILVLIVVMGTLGYIRSQKPRLHKPGR